MAAPVPAALFAAQSGLLDTQAWLQDKFHYYRNGMPGRNDTHEDIRDDAAAGDAAAIQRLADIAARRAHQLPRAGNYTFTDADRGRLKGVAVVNRGWYNTAVPPDRRQPIEPEARQVVRVEFRRAAQLLTSSFRYVKNLGYGHNGIMSLWRYQAPGQDHHIVMKMSTDWQRRPRRGARGRLAPLVMTVGDIQLERGWMDRLARAPHIIQRFLVEDYYLAATQGTRRSPRLETQARNIDSDNEGFFLMEYCKFGDLERQLFKAARFNNGVYQWLPSPVLWRFFDCLVKACIAMEIPPRYDPMNAVPHPQFGLAPPPINGPADLPEVISAGAAAAREGIVHFDLVSILILFKFK
ncbi:hypothetical protein Daus18300_010799 [Diaporthe australafricana]|uniref:Protein kinase domain-containing protein n=1 Tax=Diaporthe australafricana TaxID=127596 RepID=A0ABR3W8T0_9PEZI